MRKDWLWISLVSVLLAACSNNTGHFSRPAAPQVWNGPVVDIPGVEPKYEAVNPDTRQDYSVNGRRYPVIQDPDNYSEVGLAGWYSNEARGSRTATGETYNPDALTAAHPALPLPGYVRVTNLANGCQLVVRINDRGPYTPGRIIRLSTAAGNRLNISANTRVRVDYIKVAPDGSLSGPGSLGTRVIKQNFALPTRPDITSGISMESATGKVETAPVMVNRTGNPQPEVHINDNNAPHNRSDISTPLSDTHSLAAPQPLRSDVSENSRSPASSVPAVTTPVVAAPGTVLASSSLSTPDVQGHFVVQAGAMSDAGRAQYWLESLSKRFGVPGTVTVHNQVYRVLLGHFANRQQALALQQRLLQEAQVQSFVTVADAPRS